MKKLSVITINYNNREGLKKTIKSVINQTYRDFEYIVIDGGSSDGSVDIIKEYSHYFDYWVSEPDKGIYHAMNKGIERATGDYCIFINSGDFFYRKDVLTLSMANCIADVVTCRYSSGRTDNIGGHPSSEVSLLDFIKGSIPHPSSFIKRKLFENNTYDENLKIVSDWKFFMEVLIFRNCSFQKLDVVVSHFNNQGISSTSVEQNQNERYRVLSEMLPPRILSDYQRFAKADSPVLKLTPYLNQTYLFHKFIYKLLAFLIQIHSGCRNLFYNGKKI